MTYEKHEAEAERLLDDALAAMLNGDPSTARYIARSAIAHMDEMHIILLREEATA